MKILSIVFLHVTLLSTTLVTALFALPVEAHVISIKTVEGTEVTLRIVNNTIVGDSLNGRQFSPTEMLGARFVLSGSGANTTVAITDYNSRGVESWVSPGKFYPTYELSYIENHDGVETAKPVCPANLWNPTMTEPKTTFGIIFSDQAFDSEGNDMTSGAATAADDSWLSIACAGGALAKKTLMGYDLQAAPPNNTTREENQTILAMITARYCGATRFTKNGTAVYWQNDRGWFNPPENLNIEAIWNAQGAVCLNEPRKVSRAAVVAECGALPRCDDFDVSAYHLTSYLAN